MLQQATPRTAFSPGFQQVAAAAMRWPRHGGDGFAPGFTPVAAAAMRWPRHGGEGFGQPTATGPFSG